MNLLKNVISSKYSTGVGLVAIFLVISVIFGFDITPLDNLAKWLNITPNMLIIYLGLGISGIMNLLSKDPTNKTKEQDCENSVK